MLQTTNQPRDLFRCLDEYPLAMLQALALTWGVESALDKPALITELILAMTTPDAIRNVLATCSQRAQQALGFVVSEMGGIPSHRLVVNYGQIRKLGPARLERDTPWLKPQSPLEELYFKGLLYRAYGNLPDYLGEVLWLPVELVSKLQPLLIAVSQPESHEVTPSRVDDRGCVLVEDMLALTARLKIGKFRSLKRPGPMLKLPWEYLELEGRLLGGVEPDYLSFIERLAVSARLITVNEGYLRPSSRARTWLQAGNTRQRALLYLAWLNESTLGEFANSFIHFTGKKEPQFKEAKHNLVGVLAHLRPATWYGLKAFTTYLKSVRPDFLRTDGDYDTWVVTTQLSDKPVRGYATWEYIEGELAKYLVLKPLYWLGIIALGSDLTGTPPSVFCLTQSGFELLNNVKTEASTDTRATADDSFIVSLPVQDSAYERYQLERFSTWQSQTDTARYLLSERSVWEGVNSGITVAQMMRFLERICAGQVSPVIKRSLQAWGGHFGRVTLTKSVIIQVADPETMDIILKHSDIRRLLGVAVSPTQRLVPSTNLAVLIERLKQIGIWPTIKL